MKPRHLARLSRLTRFTAGATRVHPNSEASSQTVIRSRWNAKLIFGWQQSDPDYKKHTHTHFPTFCGSDSSYSLKSPGGFKVKVLNMYIHFQTDGSLHFIIHCSDEVILQHVCETLCHVDTCCHTLFPPRSLLHIEHRHDTGFETSR